MDDEDEESDDDDDDVQGAQEPHEPNGCLGMYVMDVLCTILCLAIVRVVYK